MAEGFAIAGILLATWPITIAAIERYKNTPLSNDVKRLVNSLQVLELTYRNCIKQLLRDLVEDDLAQKLLADPRGPAWQEESLKEKLSRYLDDDAKCDVYIEAIGDIKDMVREVDARFSGPERPSKSRLLRFLKGFTDKPRGEAGLTQLRSRIEDLRRLTRQSSELAAPRHRRALPMKVYENIRNSAAHLYEALADGWACDCEAQHHANLLLETRKDPLTQSSRPGTQIENRNDILRFRFLFSFRSMPENEQWRELEIAPISSGDSLNGHQEITNLCQFIRDLDSPVRQTRDCLGYLYDKGTEKYHGLFTVIEAESARESPRTISLPLAQILTPSHNQHARRAKVKLSKGASVRLAVVLSSTVLQLHSTPWLDSCWGKEELYYVDPVHEFKEKKIFLQHKFESTRVRQGSVASTSSGTLLTRTTTNTFNIPWAPNETLYSLGIILLELALRQSINAADSGAVATSAREVEKEIGSKYYEALRNCLHCNFDLPSKKLVFTDPDFQQQVLDKVIRPLEECSQGFPVP